MSRETQPGKCKRRRRKESRASQWVFKWKINDSFKEMQVTVHWLTKRRRSRTESKSETCVDVVVVRTHELTSLSDFSPPIRIAHFILWTVRVTTNPAMHWSPSRSIRGISVQLLDTTRRASSSLNLRFVLVSRSIELFICANPWDLSLPSCAHSRHLCASRSFALFFICTTEGERRRRRILSLAVCSLSTTTFLLSTREHIYMWIMNRTSKTKSSAVDAGRKERERERARANEREGKVKHKNCLRLLFSPFRTRTEREEMQLAACTYASNWSMWMGGPALGQKGKRIEGSRPPATSKRNGRHHRRRRASIERAPTKEKKSSLPVYTVWSFASKKNEKEKKKRKKPRERRLYLY